MEAHAHGLSPVAEAQRAVVVLPQLVLRRRDPRLDRRRPGGILRGRWPRLDQRRRLARRDAKRGRQQDGAEARHRCIPSPAASRRRPLANPTSPNIPTARGRSDEPPQRLPRPLMQSSRHSEAPPSPAGSARSASRARWVSSSSSTREPSTPTTSRSSGASGGLAGPQSSQTWAHREPSAARLPREFASAVSRRRTPHACSAASGRPHPAPAQPPTASR